MAAGYLLDTNVLSETRKTRANQGVLDFLAGLDANLLFISALTLGELYKGVELKRKDDARVADQLNSWVHSIETTFADQVLPIDASVARIWGKLSADRSLPVIDALIAATALAHSLTLVTRNVRDMKVTGAKVIDPWHVR